MTVLLNQRLEAEGHLWDLSEEAHCQLSEKSDPDLSSALELQSQTVLYLLLNPN